MDPEAGMWLPSLKTEKTASMAEAERSGRKVIEDEIREIRGGGGAEMDL